MRVCVAGGAGFIGSNVVRLLLNQGHQVTVFDNLSTGYRENLVPFPEVSLVPGDIRDRGKLGAAMEGADVVFHLAASIGNVKSLSNPQEDSEVNVIGTLNVLDAARRCGVKTVIYSSSAAIFGEPQAISLDETHPVEPDSPYGVSKLAGEKHVLWYGRAYGLRTVCLRYFNVYGINQRYDAYGNVIPIFLTRIMKGEPLTVYGDGEQTRDFVNVKDVAAANVAAAECVDAEGVFNIGSGQAITLNQLVQAVQEATGTQTEVHYTPPRKGEVLHSLADITKARSVLGLNPRTDMVAELREYYEWLRQDTVSKV